MKGCTIVSTEIDRQSQFAFKKQKSMKSVARQGHHRSTVHGLPLFNHNLMKQLIDFNYQQIIEIDASTGELIHEFRDKIYAIKQEHPMTGYIHKNRTRCTILNDGIDCHTIELNKETNKFTPLYHESIQQDASLIVDGIECPDQGGKLKLVKSLLQNADQKDQYTLKIVDLDQELPKMSKNSKASQSQFKIKNLYFKSFDKQLNNEGMKWEIRPFVRVETIQDLAETQCQYYSTQLILLDLLTGYLHVSFINAVCPDTDTQNCQLQKMAPKMLSQNLDEVIEYPILCYTPHDNEKRTIMFCNLQKNNPQIKLKLPYRFVCFLRHESALQKVERKYYMNVEIYFLVHYKQDQLLQLKLTIQPWISDTYDEFQLSLVDLHCIDQDMYNLQNVRKVSSLQNIEPITGNKTVTIVVQLDSTIIVIQKGKELKSLFLQNDMNDYVSIPTMLPIQMFRLQDFILYAQYSVRKGNEIVALKQDILNTATTVQSIYSSNEGILQFQLGQSDKKNTEILVLDRAYKLRIFGLDETKDSMTISLVEAKTIYLNQSQLCGVLKSLEQIPWSTCLISSVAIISCHSWTLEQDLDGKSYWKIDRTLKVNSIINQSEFQRDFLEFPKSVCGKNQAVQSEVLKIIDINHLGHYLQVCNEGDMKYYLSTMRPGQRRIDLFQSSQITELSKKALSNKKLAFNMHVMNNFILVNFNNRILIFDQDTIMLQKIYTGKVTRVSCDPKNGVKYAHIDAFNSEPFAQVVHFNPANFEPTRVEFKTENHNHHESHRLLRSRTQHQQNELIKSYYLSSHVYDSKQVDVRELVTINQKDSNEDDDDEQRDIIAVHCKVQDIQSNSKTKVYYIKIRGERIHKCKHNQVVLTANFMVIGLSEKIYYIALSKIKFFDLSQGEAYIYRENLHPLNCINLDEMLFGKNTLKFGYRISSVQNTARRFHDIDEQVHKIQISFDQHAVIWDLVRNSESHSQLNIDCFQSIEGFVDTGFDYFKFQEQESSERWKFYETNDVRTVALIPSDGNSHPCLFRSYTQHDLNNLIQIQSLVQRKQQHTVKQVQISYPLLTCGIRNQTFFTLFHEQIQILELVKVKLVGSDLILTDNVQYQNLMRRIIENIDKTFFDPFPEFESKTENQDQESDVSVDSSEEIELCVPQERKSITFDNYAEIFEKERIGDNLLKYMIKNKIFQFETLMTIMLQLPNEIDTNRVIRCFEDFCLLFDSQSETVDQFMKHLYINTPMTEMWTHVNCWPDGCPGIIISANTSNLSNDQIKIQIEQALKEKDSTAISLVKYLVLGQGTNAQKRLLQLRIVNVQWLNGNIIEFYQYLQERNNLSLYDNELIKLLLIQQDYSLQLFGVIIVPYSAYLISLLIYFTLYVPNSLPEADQGQFFAFGQKQATGLRVLICGLTAYLLNLEFKQAMKLGTRYLLHMWNYIQILMIMANLSVVVEHATSLARIEKDILVKFSSLLTAVVWFNFYYQLRSYPRVAFYVSLLMETVKDLALFLGFYIMIIITFATIILVLDQYYKELINEGLDYTELIKPSSGHHVFDAILMMWSLGIGEFNITYYDNKHSVLPYFIFILATFFTNIVFLNMLINIMGDTLERMKEQRDRVGLVERTQLISDFIHHFKVDKKLNNNSFVYLVKPEQNSTELEDANCDDYGMHKINASLIKLERQNKKYRKEMMHKLYILEKQQVDQYHGINDKLSRHDPNERQKACVEQVVRRQTIAKMKDSIYCTKSKTLQGKSLKQSLETVMNQKFISNLDLSKTYQVGQLGELLMQPQQVKNEEPTKLEALAMQIQNQLSSLQLQTNEIKENNLALSDKMNYIETQVNKIKTKIDFVSVNSLNSEEYEPALVQANQNQKGLPTLGDAVALDNEAYVCSDFD